MAVRAALGASRADLARPLLAETFVLFALGGALGAALMRPAGGRPARLPSPVRDPPAPRRAPRLAGGPLRRRRHAALRACSSAWGPPPGPRGSTWWKRSSRAAVASWADPGTARRAFVAVQAALSLVLLFGSGLFLRELQRARAFDPGYRIADVGLRHRGPVPPRAGATPRPEGPSSRPGSSACARDPGVTAAALVRQPPLGLGSTSTLVLVDGLEPPTPDGFRGGLARGGPRLLRDPRDPHRSPGATSIGPTPPDASPWPS